VDGFELTGRIRSDPRYLHTPILAFTSTLNEQFKQRGVKAGMNGLILKTDRAALIEAIRAQVERLREVA
jgi:two-component system, chemotaxis family, sensor kinase CheA